MKTTSFAMRTKPFAQPGSRRILVADDSPTVLHILTCVLKGEGYSVVEANDGREAFRILSADCDFAAVILDVEMPCLTGPDLAKHMQTERRLMRIPVMIMTNVRDPQTHFDSLAAGAAVFLPKPFTSDQVRLTLRLLEGKRRAVQKLRAA